MPGRKQPYAITLPDRPLFAFAGLWERWQPRAGDPIETFTIVTTDANEAVAEVHDRMPAILPADGEDAWLHDDADAARKLLVPYAGAVTLRAVSRRVSDPKVDAPECLDDAEAQWGQQQLL